MPKVSELMANVTAWHTVTRGRMERIGFADGYLLIMYKGSQTIYITGPNVPDTEVPKLLKVPYPDAILKANQKKHDWKTFKVQA